MVVPAKPPPERRTRIRLNIGKYMWRERAVKRGYNEINTADNGATQEETPNAQQENVNNVTSYKVDWAEQWPQVGEMNVRENRITFKTTMSGESGDTTVVKENARMKQLPQRWEGRK